MAPDKESSMNFKIQVLALVAVCALAGCAQAPAPEPPDTRAADEAAIRAAIEEWRAAAQAKDADKFVSFYTGDAVVMMEDAPDLRGIDALRGGIGGMMQDPNFALAFEAVEVVVARSGDLAYETGTYTMTMSDPQQKPATEIGHYVVVWRKQPDGAWKVVVDVPVSDPAPAAATP
jgi:uncharacterized protein (TIGR02246 family)